MSNHIDPLSGASSAAFVAASESKRAHPKRAGSREPQPDTLRPHPDHEAEASCFGYIEECCCNIFLYFAGLAISAYDWICESLSGKNAFEKEFDDLAKNLPFLEEMPFPCKIFIVANPQLGGGPLVATWLLNSRDGCAENLREVYSRLKAKAGEDGDMGHLDLRVSACHQREDTSRVFSYSRKIISAKGIGANPENVFLPNTGKGDVIRFFERLSYLPKETIAQAVHDRPSGAQVVLDRVITPHDSGKPIYLSTLR
ncbi:MAG: hypothetical protein HYX48_01130 [Chlamydiales bacterium]|nr:hypothetical protein [Chlamydiales bacterium]